MKTFVLALTIALTAISCGTLDVYEKTTPFPQHAWNASQQPYFTFTINDTASLYNIYIVFRHEDAYRFNNVWLNVTTTAPLGIPISQQVELPLGDNKKGWLGTGMDDIFTHRIRITQGPIKLKKGNYQFTIAHIMRENPLQFVLNAGIRVEKYKP
jgi:gliding motility-associated lipoprotein GldH